VKLQMISAARIAGTTGIVGHAEVVDGDGEIIEMEVLLTDSKISRLQTRFKSDVVGISLDDGMVLVSGPLEKKDLVRTSPEFCAAECLIISERNLTNICSVPLEEGGGKEVSSICSDSNNTKNSKKSSRYDTSDEENLAVDNLASTLNFLSFHYLI